MGHPIIQGQGEVNFGQHSSIGENVRIIFARPARVELGDYVILGDNVKMIVDGGDVRIGDWTTLHSDTLVLSKTGVSIGDHCWFGQNTILDGTGGLTIKNGVRVGMYSQLWTHVAAGEQIEGCTLIGERPILIEDDVWLVGSCIVASGLTIGRRAVALIGSNITKNVEPNTVIAGAPAKLKEGLNFYKSVTLDEKFEMLNEWLRSFAGAPAMDTPIIKEEEERVSVVLADGSKITFFKRSGDFEHARMNAPAHTICCVENKKYVKTLNLAEKSVLKFLAGNKARFYPVEA